MKKLLSVVSTIIVLAAFSGCSKNSENKSSGPGSSGSPSANASIAAPVWDAQSAANNIFYLNEQITVQEQEGNYELIFSTGHVYQKVGDQLFLVSGPSADRIDNAELVQEILSNSRCEVTGPLLSELIELGFISGSTSTSESGDQRISLIGNVLNQEEGVSSPNTNMVCTVTSADRLRGIDIVDEIFRESAVLTDGMGQLISMPEEEPAPAPAVEVAPAPEAAPAVEAAPEAPAPEAAPATEEPKDETTHTESDGE